jgi:hypothetical protein
VVPGARLGRHVSRLYVAPQPAPAPPSQPSRPVSHPVGLTVASFGMYRSALGVQASLLKPAWFTSWKWVGCAPRASPRPSHWSHQSHWSRSVTVQAATPRCMGRNRRNMRRKSVGMPQLSHHTTPACARAPPSYVRVSHPADARHRALGGAQHSTANSRRNIY